MRDVNSFLTSFSYEGKSFLLKAVDSVNSSIYSLFGGRKVTVQKNGELDVGDYQDKNQIGQAFLFLVSLPLFIATCPIKGLSLLRSENKERISKLKQKVNQSADTPAKNTTANVAKRLFSMNLAPQFLQALTPETKLELFQKKIVASKQAAEKELGSCEPGDYRIFNLDESKVGYVYRTPTGELIAGTIEKKEQKRDWDQLFRKPEENPFLKKLEAEGKFANNRKEANEQLINGKKLGDYRLIKNEDSYDIVCLNPEGKTSKGEIKKEELSEEKIEHALQSLFPKELFVHYKEGRVVLNAKQAKEELNTQLGHPGEFRIFFERGETWEVAFVKKDRQLDKFRIKANSEQIKKIQETVLARLTPQIKTEPHRPKVSEDSELINKLEAEGKFANNRKEANEQLINGKKLGDYRLIKNESSYAIICLNPEGKTSKGEIKKEELSEEKIEQAIKSLFPKELFVLYKEGRVVLNAKQAKEALNTQLEHPGEFRIFYERGETWKVAFVKKDGQLGQFEIESKPEEINQLQEKIAAHLDPHLRKFNDQAEYRTAIKGLKEGEYFLRERQSKPGYLELVHKFKTGVVKIDFENNDALKANIEKFLEIGKKNDELLFNLTKIHRYTLGEKSYPAFFSHDPALAKAYLEKYSTYPGVFILFPSTDVSGVLLFEQMVDKGLLIREEIALSQNVEEKLQELIKRHAEPAFAASALHERQMEELRKNKKIAANAEECLDQFEAAPYLGKFRLWKNANDTYTLGMLGPSESGKLKLFQKDIKKSDDVFFEIEALKIEIGALRLEEDEKKKSFLLDLKKRFLERNKEYNLDSNASFEALARANRKAALKLHPDKGGSKEGWDNFNAEWEQFILRISKCREIGAGNATDFKKLDEFLAKI